MVGARLKDHYAAEARKRQAHGQTAPGKTLTANLPEASGEAREKAADAVNVSPRLNRSRVCRRTVERCWSDGG